MTVTFEKFIKLEAKKQRRANREIELAGRIRALPERKFGVIYADPPWTFKTRSEEGEDRSARNHYATMSITDIGTLPVWSIAADDCVLFMWATVPMLEHALNIMKVWGFQYKSHTVWVKDRIGTGYWFRNMHELLLVGTRGNIPAPAMGDQYPSAMSAVLGKHSEKPEGFYRVIENYFPNLPKIELFANVWRPGWTTWGAGH